MNDAALVIAVPLLAAAALAALGKRLPRWLTDALSISVAALNLVLCAHLAWVTGPRPEVYWFGGWRPGGGVTPGVGFFVDPVGAGLAAFTSLLMLAAFGFSIRYFKEIRAHFHALMLVFLAAMCAFSLTGDLFNLFVWFELMTGSGIALCGYKVEELGPLQGAMNFAVTNTIGAFLALTGIILIYGHTGALNMAQIAQALQRAPADPLVTVSFVFIACGFLVKAAAVPFHFWLADAHAVAPTPVCVLFSGIMVELGLYAVARVYGAVFARALAPQAALLHGVLLAMGVLTALTGGVMSYLQRHLKRLLAFSTISHVGLMIVGFSYLSSDALAGTGLYVIGHGLVKAALFICVGILLNRFACVDEHQLKGRGKGLVGLTILFGALGLSGLPPYVQFKGVALIEHASENAGESWVIWVLVAAGALTAGAVVRVWARVFLDWGTSEKSSAAESSGEHEEPETQGGTGSPFLYFPAVALLLISLTLTWIEPFVTAVQRFAPQLGNIAGYQARVLDNAAFVPVEAAALPSLGPAAAHSAIAFLLACALAAAGLYLRAGPLKRAARWCHELHSGQIGDYLAWFAVGVAAYVGVLLWASP